MKSLVFTIAVAALAVANVASAHAHLHMSTPVNHSIIAEVPKQVSLQFNEPVMLTSLTIQKGDGPVTKLGPLPDVPAKDFALAAPKLDSGSYIVKWRAVSDDGHIMADKLLFTVGPAAK